MSRLQAYAVYGTRFSTSFRFANRLAPAAEGTDFLFAVHGAAAGDEDAWSSASRVDLGRLADGQPFLSIMECGEDVRLLYTEVADFRLTRTGIQCHVLDPAYEFTVEIYLLGFVLSYWIERYRRIPPLHAAAVVIGGRAVAFTSTNKGGKTSLAAALMAAGHPLLTDDILALTPAHDGMLGQPGYPQMRMWPDQAQHFVGPVDQLPLVHPSLSKRRLAVGTGGLGRFCYQPRPVSAIYVPQRRDDSSDLAVQISDMPAAVAVKILTDNVFVGPIFRGADDLERRFRFIADVVRAVPIRSLSYPSGTEHLPRVRRAILQDVEALDADAVRTPPQGDANAWAR